MPKRREPLAEPAMTGSDLLDGENQAIQRLIGGRTHAQLSYVRLEDLDPNPFNPRQNIDVTELADSMREHGFIGALDGRLIGRRVQLAYGARRLAAAKAAGIEQIPVYLHPDWDDDTLLTLSLVENVQREDLSPLEAAVTIQQMNDRLGWSQRDIARRTGKSHSWVRDMLAVAKAGEIVQTLVRERPDAIRHARFIAQLDDESARQRLAAATREEDLTVDQVYRITQAVREGADVEAALAEMRDKVEIKIEKERSTQGGGELQGKGEIEAGKGSAQESKPAPGGESAQEGEGAQATEGAARAAPRPGVKRTTLQVLEGVQMQLARVELQTLRDEAPESGHALRAALLAIRSSLAAIEGELAAGEVTEQAP